MAANIIHVGYHKTATNWFQRVAYPRVTNYRYVPREVVAKAFLSCSAFKFDAESARATLGCTADEPLILCEEELSGNIHTGGLFGFLSQEVARRLHQTLPDSRIVLVIRNQSDMIASVYKQYVKEGGTHSIDRYIHPYSFVKRTWFEPYKSPLFSFDHFEYYPLIKFYQSLFGKDRVSVYLYEEFTRDNQGFFNMLAGNYDFELAPGALPTTRLNKSWSKPVLNIARTLNLFTCRDVLDKYYLVNIPKMKKKTRLLSRYLMQYRLFDSNFDTASVLGKENVRFINERYAEGNRLLARELCLPLEEHHYPLRERN